MDINIDAIIKKLLVIENARGYKLADLSEREVEYLCVTSKDIFMKQPVFLEIEAPINVCGDIHGQYKDLLKLLAFVGHPPDQRFLFLGDYVDRGKQSLETICLLMAYKIKYPERVYLLRGNHECASINRIYGFYDECKRRYSSRMWKVFTETFNCMPIAALINGRIFCMHGGLSPELEDLAQLRTINRPTDVPDRGLLCDLLWSDPEFEISGWEDNDRGVSYIFGEDIVRTMADKFDLDLIVRAHQVVEDGYEFFADKRLVTVFSAPNYCGEFDNAGGVMCIDESLVCSFKILKPNEKNSNNNDNSVQREEVEGKI